MDTSVASVGARGTFPLERKAKDDLTGAVCCLLVEQGAKCDCAFSERQVGGGFQSGTSSADSC
jgi:hypothetical protein